MNAIFAEPQSAPSNGTATSDESLANELLKSYRGKIGKLPRAIRHELCHRLNKSESATKIIAWVNELPEARAVFDAEFNGKGITPQNLSEWRKGGYRDWLQHQVACERVRLLGDFAADLSEVQSERLSEQLAIVYAARLQVTLEKILGEATDSKEEWQLLKEGLREIRMLRRGDHAAARLVVQEKRLELERVRVDFLQQNPGKSRNIQPNQGESISEPETPPKLVTEDGDPAPGTRPYAELRAWFARHYIGFTNIETGEYEAVNEPKVNPLENPESPWHPIYQEFLAEDAKLKAELGKDPALTVAPEMPGQFHVGNDPESRLRHSGIIIWDLRKAAMQARMPYPDIMTRDAALLEAWLDDRDANWFDEAAHTVLEAPKSVMDPRLDPNSPWHAIYLKMHELSRLIRWLGW